MSQLSSYVSYIARISVTAYCFSFRYRSIARSDERSAISEAADFRGTLIFRAERFRLRAELVSYAERRNRPWTDRDVPEFLRQRRPNF